LISFINKKLFPDDLENLVFGQQHYGTQTFFIDLFGQYHTIPLRQFPHFQFLDQNNLNPNENSVYMDYLKASWGYLKGPEKNSRESRIQRINEFISLFQEFKKTKRFSTPIKICKRPDGKFILIDGNHRASIALKLGIPIYAKVITPSTHLRNVSLVKGEFYGAGRLGMPYQSIFYGKKELVRGRRSDILKRIQKIEKSDLENKSVIDLGSNLGGNCYLANYFGARSSKGIDFSKNLISASIRMNAFFTTDCFFIVHDLNETISSIEPADTVFCFSITSHLKNTDNLVKTIQTITKKTLYFEGHSNTKFEDYPKILNNTNFSKIDLIGFNQASIDNKKLDRPFFRCEI
jgi:hypothetical protein